MKTIHKFIIFLILCCISVHSFAAVIILNGLTHTHSTSKGGVLSGKIKIKNDGKKEARVVIYKQDLVMSCDSPFDYQDINKHERSMGSWLKTNVDEKLLQPLEEYEISYTVNVPENISRAGTYWAEIMIESADPLTEEKKGNITIGSKVRYAVNIIADIGGFENPKLTFENIGFKTGDSTSKTVQIKIRNNGSFVSKTKLSIEIYNKSGEKIKVVEGIYKRIYPERCNDFEIQIKDLPKGKYEGVIVADNGKDLFGANMTIEID